MSIDIRNRKPKGIPVGGQYDFWTHGEAPTPLKVETQRMAYAARQELFAANAYVPATTVDAVAPTTSTAMREEWWDRAKAAGEFGVDGKAYKKMGEYAGNSNRRTGRHRYNNGDISLRIPNATAIRRQSKEFGNQTFDVPLAVSIKGGPDKEGYVRVTKTGPSTWTATALGGDGTSESEAMISEAVTALLESRRVTTALPALGVGGLLERRKARAAAAGTNMSPIKSAFLDEVGYDDESKTMAVSINNKVYGHQVPRSFFDTVRSSDRPGSLYNQLIKPTPRQEVTRCQQCFRFTSTAAFHDCPSGHKPESAVIDASTLADRAHAAHITATRAGAPRPPGIEPTTPPVDVPAPTVQPPADTPVPAPVTTPAPAHNLGTKTGRAAALLEARGLMSKLLALKPGAKVLVDGKEMEVQAYTPEQFGHPDTKSVLQVGYGAGRYNRELSTATIAEGYVKISIPEQKAGSTHPDPLVSTEDYLQTYAALAQSAANHGLDLAQGTFQGEVKAAVYTPDMRLHATVSENGVISRFQDDAPIEAFDPADPQARTLQAWTESQARHLSKVTDGLLHRGHYSDAPAPTPAPLPAHLQNPIQNMASYTREYSEVRNSARTSGFDVSENSAERVCEVRTSTDSFFAHVAVERDGSLQRYLNSRPVDAYDAKHPEAQKLETWARENALKMARITDASKRRRAPTPVA